MFGTSPVTHKSELHLVQSSEKMNIEGAGTPSRIQQDWDLSASERYIRDVFGILSIVQKDRVVSGPCLKVATQLERTPHGNGKAYSMYSGRDRPEEHREQRD